MAANLGFSKAIAQTLPASRLAQQILKAFPLWPECRH
jgi:hypothetical protein